MSETPNSPNEGLSEPTACGLAYITIIPAIIFLVVAPYNTNPNIKFHAWQSIFLGIAAFVLGFINIIPILGQLIFLIGILILFILWLMCVIKAFSGGRFNVPVIAGIAAKQAGL